MSKEIHVGEVVRLNGEKINMTIIKKHGENITAVWFDIFNRLQTGDFHSDALTKIEKDRKEKTKS